MKTYDKLSESGVEELCDEVMDRDRVIIELWNALGTSCSVTQDKIWEKYRDFIIDTKILYGEQ